MISTIVITVQRPVATLLVTATRSGVPSTVVINRGRPGSDAEVTAANIATALGYVPATAAQGALADGALPKSGGTMTGNFITAPGFGIVVNTAAIFNSGTSFFYGGTTAATHRTALRVPASDPTGITGADAVSNLVSLSQAEYDAIGAPVATTLYVIV